MEDKNIINLYWQRNQDAITETASKYGSYCKFIAKNILFNDEDAEECVNDTYLNAWNSIPPQKPRILSTYLGKITRHLSFDKYRHNNALKRGNGEIPLILDELEECVSGIESIENNFDKKQIIEEINIFLNSLKPQKRDIFLCRYWYAMPIRDISKQFKITENNVSIALKRTRDNLKSYLTERGYDI